MPTSHLTPAVYQKRTKAIFQQTPVSIGGPVPYVSVLYSRKMHPPKTANPSLGADEASMEDSSNLKQRHQDGQSTLVFHSDVEHLYSGPNDLLRQIATQTQVPEDVTEDKPNQADQDSSPVDQNAQEQDFSFDRARVMHGESRW